MLLSQLSLITEHSYLEVWYQGGSSEISKEHTPGFMLGVGRGQNLGQCCNVICTGVCFSNAYILTVSYHKAFIFKTLVPQRIFWDSKTIHPWVHAWGGARGQNLGQLGNVICIYFSFQMLISWQLLITKHSYLKLLYLWGSSEIPKERIPGFMPGDGAWGQNLGHLCNKLHAFPLC